MLLDPDNAGFPHKSGQLKGRWLRIQISTCAQSTWYSCDTIYTLVYDVNP